MNDGLWLSVASVILAIPAGLAGWKSLFRRKLHIEEVKNMGQEPVRGMKGFWLQVALKYPEKRAFPAEKVPQTDWWKSRTKIKWGWFALVAKKTKAELVLYLDTGDREETLSFYEGLKAKKESIEMKLGDALEWNDMQNCRAKRITLRLAKLRFMEGSSNDELIKTFCSKMPLFEKTLLEYI